jgi:hypothetical protein
MKTSILAFLLLVSAAAAGAAVAGDRLSEAAYLKAARCQGLAHAASLGPVDATAIDALMLAQGEGRDVRVRNQAKLLSADARRTADRALNKASLTRELGTRCAAWVSTQTVARSDRTTAR